MGREKGVKPRAVVFLEVGLALTAVLFAANVKAQDEPAPGDQLHIHRHEGEKRPEPMPSKITDLKRFKSGKTIEEEMP